MSTPLQLPLRDASSCAPSQHGVMNVDDAETTARVLKALADPARLRILAIVAASTGQESCVCDLQDPLGLSQPTVSHHLKVLVDAGFLSRSKRGTWAYYALVPGSLDGVARAITTL